MTERTAAVRAEEDRKLVMVSREKLEDLLTAHCWSCDKLDVANEFCELLAQPADPVRWGAPRTVRELMRQLATLDPELEVFAMHRMPADFRDGRQVAAVHLSSSYERVTGRFLSNYKGDGRKVIAFWCQADERQTVEPAPLVVPMPTFEDYPASMERDLQAAFKQAIEATGGRVTP